MTTPTTAAASTSKRRPRTLGRRPHVDLLDPAELERTHEATLEVLERTGVSVRSDRILGLLAQSDAVVDAERRVVRFPRSMVERALAAAPRSYLLAARDRAFDLLLDRSQGYYCIEGGLSEIVDLHTGQVRSPVYQDLVEATRFADALDEISFLWPCTAMSDVPPQDQAVHQTYVQLANASKHVVAMTTYNERDARAVVEMGTVLAGGSGALRDRPVVSSFACSISPLTWDGQPLEAALVFAAAGVPCGVVSMPVSTAGAPTTTAGQVVVANAEILSGITILQTLHPGAPTYYCPFSADMDLLTGNLDAAWGPEPVLFNLAMAQLGRRYGLPMCIGTNGTGAKTQDWQAGAQHMLILMGTLACGDIDLIACTGGIDSSRVFSYEQVLLDCELWDVAARLLQSAPFTEEYLAVGVIDEVGPGKHFLAHKHTRAHMREHWRARFFASDTWQDWEAAGRPDPRDRARGRARDLVTTHRPDPLPEDVDQELRSIVAHFTSEGASP
jgi:trimethylamine--corrinoid protein Co-methyltransferase